MCYRYAINNSLRFTKEGWLGYHSNMLPDEGPIKQNITARPRTNVSLVLPWAVTSIKFKEQCLVISVITNYLF